MILLRRVTTMLGLAALLTALSACGSPGDSTPIASIAPASPDVEPGAVVKFIASVAGTVDESAGWSVVEPDGGTIDATGSYTAPQNEGTYTVLAAFTSLSTTESTAVRVKRNVRVDVSPTSATLAPGDSIALTAAVTGNVRTVTWSVAEAPDGGTVTAAGVYTAPQTAGTYDVVATSTADPSKNGVATITVTAPPLPVPPPPTVAITLTPQAASVVAGNTVPFTASVTGSTDTGVIWSVAEAGGGTVSATGLYTAPLGAGTYHVVATSHADATKTASGSITVSQPVPVISSFTASPSSITQGASTMLSWSVSGATTISIDNGVGSVTGVSGKSVAPSTTTRYTLTATNGAQSVSTTAVVTVTIPTVPPSGNIGSCTALVSSTSSVATSSLAKPGYLQSVIDPDFGTKITRVTGVPGTAIPNPFGDASLNGLSWNSEPAGPTYAKDPHWNADMSLLVVKRGVPGNVFLDGQTYQPRFYRARGRDEFVDWRWHPTNAQYAIYAKTNGEVGWWDPRADTVHVKLASSGLSGCRIGDGEGNVSNDGRFLVLQCGTSFFAIDMGLTVSAPAVKYPTITASSLGLSNLDWASISPLGTRVLASQDSTLTKSAPLSLSMTASNFTVSFASGHFDVGIAADGSEVAYKAGGAAMFTLATGAATNLTSIGAWQYHSSLRNIGSPGWGYGTLESTYGIMKGEIVAQELKAGGQLRRLAHHRTNVTSGSGGIEPAYDHMPFAVPSSDGKRVFFRSDWGDASTTVVGYVVDTRNLCP